MARHRFEGTRRFRKRLAKIPEAVRAAAATSDEKSARLLVNLMQSRVPVKSGKLRASIVATPPGQSPPPYGQGSRGVNGPLTWTVTAGNSDVRYAHLVEFPTPPHMIGGFFKGQGLKHPGTVAQPFFYPSYRQLKGRIKNARTRALKKAIQGTGTSGR